MWLVMWCDWWCDVIGVMWLVMWCDWWCDVIGGMWLVMWCDWCYVIGDVMWLVMWCDWWYVIGDVMWLVMWLVMWCDWWCNAIGDVMWLVMSCDWWCHVIGDVIGNVMWLVVCDWLCDVIGGMWLVVGCDCLRKITLGFQIQGAYSTVDTRWGGPKLWNLFITWIINKQYKITLEVTFRANTSTEVFAGKVTPIFNYSYIQILIYSTTHFNYSWTKHG